MSDATEKLWCCHVIGPDDVHAAPDQATAQRWVDMVNSWRARFEEPLFSAEVIEYPWSASDHAEAVPKSIKNMEPRS